MTVLNRPNMIEEHPDMPMTSQGLFKDGLRVLMFAPVLATLVAVLYRLIL